MAEKSFKIEQRSIELLKLNNGLIGGDGSKGQKKILTIQDLSCTGRCSITVALPLLSGLGLHVAVIPTSVLSTHTGGFTGIHHKDMTEHIRPIVEHFKSLNIHFDGIYVGFLAHEMQMQETLYAINELKSEDTRIYIDPAMADEGKLYSLLPETYPSEVKRLTLDADLICPNMTEASMLTGIEYKDGLHTKEYIVSLIEGLKIITKGDVVLTGVHLEADSMGAASYSRSDNKLTIYEGGYIPGTYYGTGDVFMSTLIGAREAGKSLDEAMALACRYVYSCIYRTKQEGTDYRYGVDFENGLGELYRLVHS